jgi:uncharacterized membrane protein
VLETAPVPAAATWYDIWKLLHVLAAIVWVGGALMLNILAWFALRSKLPGRRAEFAREAEKVGMRLFAPAGLLLVIMGFVLVEKGNWGYHLWVILGLIAYGLSFLTGLLFIGPESGRIGKAIETEGPESPTVAARIDRILLISRIELVILFLVVVDMVLKPGQ